MYLQFETNNYCNAKCSICPHQFMKKREPISDDLIDKILDECLPLVDIVIPFLYQEPLIEPRLIDIFTKIKNKKPSVFTVLHSNMACMTDEIANELMKNKLLDNLYISFYGPTLELYEKYQPPLNWEKNKNIIKNFMEIRNKGGYKKPYVTMDYISTKELMEKFESFKCEWSSVVDEIRKVKFVDFCGFIKGFETTYSPLPKRVSCTRPFEGINILCDGTVVPCCLDFNGSVPLGNIKYQNIQEILYGRKMNDLKVCNLKKDWDNLPELCRNCKEFGIG